MLLVKKHCSWIEIVVDQLSPPEVTTRGRHSWKVSVTAREVCGMVSLPLVNTPLERVVKDPFDQGQHENVREHLEETLTMQNDPSPKVKSDVERQIRSYSRKLLGSLQLQDLFGETHLSGKVLRVEVRCSKDLVINSSVNSPSIQSLHWEMLDYPEVFAESLRPKGCPAAILVRRSITGFDCPSINQQGLDRDTVNVLVVVARKEEDVWSPTQAPVAVLKVREWMRWGCHSHCVNLHVVRPGSLVALEAALKQTEVPFDVVHFDTHGQTL